MTPTPRESQVLFLVRALKGLRETTNSSYFTSLLRFWLYSESYLDEMEKVLNEKDESDASAKVSGFEHSSNTSN